MFKLTKKSKRKVIYRDRTSSLLFTVFMIILILLALNLALLLPPQISSIFYMIELIILQHFNYQVVMHRWELYFLILFFSGWGYFIFPMVYIPSIKKSHFYIWTWVEGNTRFFRTLGGYVQVHKDLVRKRIFRWTVMGDVTAIYEGNVEVLQTKNLEVTKSNFWKSLAMTLAARASSLEDIIEKSPSMMTQEDVQQLIRSMRGGGESEGK